MKQSQRMQAIQPSATLSISAKAKAMVAAGQDVVILSAGEPDFDTPAHIKQAAAAAADAGHTRYSPVAGLPSLRQAIAEEYTTVYDRKVEANQTIVTCGAKHTLFEAFATLLNPGDDVLVPTPYWVSYPDMASFCGANMIGVKSSSANQLLPSVDDFDRVVTSKTRLLVLNSPNNPSGAVYSREALEEISNWLLAHPEIHVIADDIYGDLVFDSPFVSIAHLTDQLTDRLLVVRGVSKTFAMTGWRIGYGIGPQQWISAMSRMQGASTSGANTPAQHAALAALAGERTEMDSMRHTFARRRDKMQALLQEIPDVHVPHAGGAFYLFPDIGAYLGGRCKDSVALCEYLIEEHRLAAVPGLPFGADEHIRVSYACSDDDIQRGVARLSEGLGRLAQD